MLRGDAVSRSIATVQVGVGHQFEDAPMLRLRLREPLAQYTKT